MCVPVIVSDTHEAPITFCCRHNSNRLQKSCPCRRSLQVELQLEEWNCKNFNRNWERAFVNNSFKGRWISIPKKRVVKILVSHFHITVVAMSSVFCMWRIKMWNLIRESNELAYRLEYVWVGGNRFLTKKSLEVFVGELQPKSYFIDDPHRKNVHLGAMGKFVEVK